MKVNRPRLMLAAPRSGSGKTTITCALLGALHMRGGRVASFKCGPDYIDPMFHRSALGVPSFNLDPFLLEPPELRRTLASHGEEDGVSVLEGAMGYYDGIAMTTEASGYELAGRLGVPVVLVIDCKGAAASVPAQIRGFLCHRADSNIRGVLLNRLPERLYPGMKALIERELPLRVCGYLPELPECSFESRHLGLIPAQELHDLGARLERLAQQAARSFELEALLALAKGAPALEAPALAAAPSGGVPVQIALARDEAFCFYYEEALQRLQGLGARLVPFSPLHDERLPDHIDGLLLGGGYPELYAHELSENRPLLGQLRALVRGGLPTIAECGGFMLLQESLEGTDGNRYPMAGALPGECRRQQRLCRFGYARYTALSDGLLCGRGESLPIHSFHYWDSTAPGDGFLAQKPGRDGSWREGVMTGSLYAGFGHLHLCHGELAKRFVARCRGAQKERR
ncbi:cobyrinate a,c-diamide synthase [Harryflintia acetispora]|uniref:Cobyrinate a,c-diamide synthase n=1 Tax=Harryflintia acetispora TaxID=1849041 RepID=A0A9X8Y7F8_9FIRM|nr:cobyrinate a,c-diamide synthase [Harryflintia acetispora]TCL42298.1 cobyrinic acid a,c-diamide synthase [Harryflintia acetispora]